MAEISGWQDFFLDISKLSDSAERQYGVAQLNYTEYILERLALCIDTCSNIQEIFDTSTQATELQECSHTVTELTEHLQRLHYRWGDYKSFLEGPVQYTCMLTTMQHRRGRPQFQVNKLQMEYLSSLSFKWTEIASILGVSRMTLYR